MKKYYAEDLIKKCNEALVEYYGKEESGISRRTFFEDLNDLDEIVGEYGVEILRLNDGRKKYYRYDTEGFSLFTKGFTEDELRVLKESIQTLQRFKGLPSFQWMDTLVSKLEDKLTIKSSVSNILGYEENTDYVGVEWLKAVFEAIIGQQPLQVDYRTFDNTEFHWTIHPYYIKQYNNRWHLIGYNPEFQDLSHVPLDRIDDIKPLHIEYIPNIDIDFDQYFKDVIGATVRKAKPERIVLRFSLSRLQYVLTKPIHHSQVCSDTQEGIVTLNLIPNQEFEALLLSYGPDVEVLAPETLRDQIREIIERAYNKYNVVRAGRTTSPYLCTVEPE
ncbi:MAG: WYL domain-containing protein [Bacteroidales bacterium]|nr:WYL domain-containing protein [Bacteroidales bacterium]